MFETQAQIETRHKKQRKEDAMNKKRKLALIILSPLLAAMFIAVLLVTTVGYALNGKWELRKILREDFGLG